MNHFFKLLGLFIDWFECVISPIITCRKILNSAISNTEKIYSSFCIWFIAFILSFGLEIPIYYYYGLGREYSFYISYTIFGFFYLLIQSLFIHIILLVFRIKSKYIETFIIYSVIIGAYSPFYFLLNYTNTFRVLIFLKTIKNKHIDILNNIMQGADMFNKIELQHSVTTISSITGIFGIILFSITGVFLSYLIMEQYNSNKFKSFLIITFAQILLFIPLMLLTFMKYTILYSYL